MRELKVEVAVSARAGDGAAVANWLFIEKSTKHARRSGSWRLVLCPVDPAQAGQLDVLNGLPRHGPGGPVDQFGLGVAVHRLARALSKQSPAVLIEGAAPIAARRWPYRMDVNLLDSTGRQRISESGH